MMKVKRSDIGIEYRTPSNPKKSGSNNAKPTPNTTSRIIERSVEATAFPIACRKIKQDLLIQARTIMHK